MDIIKPDENQHGLGIIHPESRTAHKYLDGLQGIEIGAASYAPFGIPGTLNVATPDEADRRHYEAVQLAVCGSYVTVDIYAEADNIPLEDHSQDFVIASHVLEHCPNPIATLLEWDRLLKPGGYIFLIVPKREAPYGDALRHISELKHFRVAYEQNWSNTMAYDFMEDRPTKEFDRPRGHYWVFDLASLLELIRWCNAAFSIAWESFDRTYALYWKLIEAHETDDTDGTGHMVVLRNEK